MAATLQELQQLYVLADETKKHFTRYGSDPDPETADRRKEAIATNLSALTGSIQYLIDQEVY